jgi:tryptophan synthase alpha chain
MTARSETPVGADRLESAIRSATSDGRLALAPFVTAGFPALDGFADLLQAVCAEADVVELGVPFSDPMADGITIQRSSRCALDAGVTLEWIFDLLRGGRWPVPLVLMSYLNPLVARGLQLFARDAVAAGVAGLIVPDLPYEESLALRDAFDDAGLALVQLVTPVTPTPRLKTLCEASRGFVYAVTMTGTTGGSVDRGRSTTEYLTRVREHAPVPVLAGFGIRDAAQLRSLAGHADGAIVGSALIEALERGDDPAEFLRSLRNPEGGVS